MPNLIAQSLSGLAVGDALGGRFFGELSEVTKKITGRIVPVAPWRYSDDTIMAISVVDVLRGHGQVNQDALAGLFAKRYVQDPARGYGAMAHQILGQLAIGQNWRFASRSIYNGSGSKGNGAAMRVARV